MWKQRFSDDVVQTRRRKVDRFAGSDREGRNPNLGYMSAHRTTQHRPRKELQEIRAAEVVELKRENQRLKRALARAHRDLEKASSSNGPPDEEPAMTEVPPILKEAVPMGCPGCGGNDFGRVKTGYKTIVACRSCSHRHTE